MYESLSAVSHAVTAEHFTNNTEVAPEVVGGNVVLYNQLMVNARAVFSRDFFCIST